MRSLLWRSDNNSRPCERQLVQDRKTEPNTNCWHQPLCCKHCRVHKIRRSHTHAANRTCQIHTTTTRHHHHHLSLLRSAQGLPPHTNPPPSLPPPFPPLSLLSCGTAHALKTLNPFCGPLPAADDDAMLWHKAAPPTQGPMRAWHASLGLAGIPHARFALSPPLLFPLPLSFSLDINPLSKPSQCPPKSAHPLPCPQPLAPCRPPPPVCMWVVVCSLRGPLLFVCFLFVCVVRVVPSLCGARRPPQAVRAWLFVGACVMSCLIAAWSEAGLLAPCVERGARRQTTLL